MSQNEALMYDDPMFSSAYQLPKEPECRFDQVDGVCSGQLQCKWEECYQIYDTQNLLVRHIEKSHVEVKRGKPRSFSTASD